MITPVSVVVDSDHVFIVAESLSFDDFCDICRKEPATSEEDLMKAFRKIDVNGDGFISNSELRKMLTTVNFALGLLQNLHQHCVPVCLQCCIKSSFFPMFSFL